MDLARLPFLGLGISAEYESNRKGIDANRFDEEHPGLLQFVEYGGDLQRGLDAQARRWAERGRPSTYHFLDLNLEEPGDLDPGWLRDTLGMARALGASWLCGDAGLWHFGPRDRGHQTLLPPVLCLDSARAVADSVARLEAESGLACLPENPPGVVYLGPLHLLDFFAEVSARAGCGLLLDVAHLAIFQRLRGLPALAGLDGFPLDRVVEVHVAGGVPRDVDGFHFVEDLHAPEPLPETWEILRYLLPRAPNLKAIVYECEMNQPAEVLHNFSTLHALFTEARGHAAAPPAGAPRPAPPADNFTRPRLLQRALVQVMYDPPRLEALRQEAPVPAAPALPAPERAALLGIDGRALRIDPLRRRKTLRPLVEELQLSCTAALAERRSLSWLEDGFFTSASFHAAIADDTPLTLALADFLLEACRAGALHSAALPDLVRYEEALARARRADLLAPSTVAVTPRALVQRAPGVSGLSFARDVIAVVQQVETFLFELSLMPQAWLCEDAPRLQLRDSTGDERYLLIHPAEGGPALTALDAGLCALLGATTQPVEVQALAPLLARFRVPSQQVPALVQSLAEEGLVRVTPEAPRQVKISPLQLRPRRG